MVLISVIIPAYNCEKTIQSTIKSVLEQSHTNLELIVVDDGSKDSTLERINELQDTRIKVLSQPNQGVAASRNNGVKAAMGDYIAFLDSDDLWTSDKLASQLEALQSTSDAGLAYSWVDWIDQSDVFQRHGSHVLANGDVFERLLLRNFIDNGSNILVKRIVLEDIGEFDSSLIPSEDWDISLRIAQKYSFICVPKVQVLYRIAGNSLSTNVEKLHRAALAILDKNFSRFPEIKSRIGRQVYGDKYRYFAFKVLEARPTLKNKTLAISFFVKSLRLEPSWWWSRINIFSVVVIKILKPC